MQKTLGVIRADGQTRVVSMPSLLEKQELDLSEFSWEEIEFALEKRLKSNEGKVNLIDYLNLDEQAISYTKSMLYVCDEEELVPQSREDAGIVADFLEKHRELFQEFCHLRAQTNYVSDILEYFDDLRCYTLYT